MGGDSCSKGHEFESWQQILDGYFFIYHDMCAAKDENKWKRGRGWPIKNNSNHRYQRNKVDGNIV